MGIPVAQLTEGELDGQGVFDVLMRAARQHIELEYRGNRFNTETYAEIYLGTMTQVLQQSMGYVLQQEKAAREADLIQAQIEQARAEIGRINAQRDLLAQQRLNLIQENANMVLQGEKLIVETELLGLQKIHQAEQTKLVKAQVTLAGLEAANVPKQGALLDAQAAKTNADTLVANQQVINLQADEALKRAQADQVAKQALKTDAEVALLDQKKKTEMAQILDAVDGVPVSGVIGKQKSLYTAQTSGFARDAEQKAAKMMIDAWSVQRTTDEGISPGGAGLSDANISKAVGALLSGIGA